MDNVELEFEDDAINLIVDKAIQRNTGARGLRSILEDIMRDVMFEIPSNPKIEKCIITKDTVENNSKPKIVENENKVIKEEKTEIRKKKVVAKRKEETA